MQRGDGHLEGARHRYNLFCGYCISVLYDLPKVKRRVRLPLPALMFTKFLASKWLLSMQDY